MKDIKGKTTHNHLEKYLTETKAFCVSGSQKLYLCYLRHITLSFLNHQNTFALGNYNTCRNV